ncbi:MAG: AAA family ATPase [Actinophytocola sp.]|nr:AAA family ATPase [Actinophytocola sp.]
MTNREVVPAPRVVFAERFALLYGEAGNPPLKRVTESVSRARAVDEQGRAVRVPAQRISDWRRGRNVPARFAGLAAVLRVLIGEARKRRSQPVIPSLYDLDAWLAWWESALASPSEPAAEAAAEQPDASSGVPEPPDYAGVCPYRGLAAFRQADSRWFFGRERSTGDLLDRLRQACDVGGFVVLVGASGAGKSSLLRAGVGSALARKPLGPADGTGQSIVALTPGVDPLKELGAQITELAEPLGEAVEMLREGVDPTAARAFAETIRHAVRQYATRHGGPEATVVLVVDQFEELFTLCDDEDIRLLFIRALHEMCTPHDDGPPAGLVVLGVRADFYHRCLAFPEIVEATHGRQMALGAMTAQELRDAVVRPAKAVGLQLEAGLVDLMLADLGTTVHSVKGRVAAAGYDAGALPLLSHALLATWQRRQANKLTIAGYLRAGGIHGAVAATAERAWGDLDEAGRTAARRILLHLVRVGDTTRDVRRRSSRGELINRVGDDAGATEQALEVLAGARLVTLDADSVEITHEALLEAWPRLRSWIDDNRAENLARQRLEADAESWHEQGRDTSQLYRGARLESTERLVGQPEAIGLTPTAQQFLATSARQHRRGRWLRRSAVALICVFALIAAGAAGIAIKERDDAEFRQIVTEAEHARASDPSLSAQLDLVAHRLRPGHDLIRSRLLSQQQSPLATPLRGHQAAVYLTSFNHDGTVLATASEDKSVRLWDLRGKPAPLGEPLTGHTSWVSSAVFSPDGSTLATAGDDGTVRFFDVSDPQRPKRLGGPLAAKSGPIYLVAFSPDGRMLATANGDNTVGLWDVSDPGKPRRLTSMRGHDAAVRSVAFHHDGRILASGSDDHEVRLWDVSEPGRPRQLGDPLTGAEDMVHSVDFSPDGRTLAVGVEDTTVRLFDVSDPADARSLGPPLTGHEGLVWSVKFSPDGRTLASGSADGTIRLWHVSDPEHVVARGSPLGARTGIVYAVGFSPDGRQLATGSDDNVARLWSLPDGVLPAHAAGVTAVATNSDDTIIATGGADRQVQLWNVEDPERPVPVGPALRTPKGVVRQLSFSPRDALLAVGSTDSSVRIWDVRDPRRPKPVGKPLTGVGGRFSPDGTLLASVDGTRLWLYDMTEPARPELLSSIDTGHSAYVTSGAFSPDGSTLATSSFDKTTRLWDISDPERPTRRGKALTGHLGPVWAVAFHPDGERLATGSGDKTLRLWRVTDAEGARPIGRPLAGHTDAVTSIAFSPDGHRMASGSYDKSARVWRTADPGSSTELTGHRGVVEAVEFTSGGGILTGSGDGTSRLWHDDLSRALARICSVTGPVLTEDVWGRYLPQLDYQPPCR